MFLLHTNVLSELRKAGDSKAHANVVAWAAGEKAAGFYISAVTLMEIQIGIRRVERRHPASSLNLRAWMSEQILVEFAGRILPIDAVVAIRCADFHVPNSAPYKDSLIAATALVHNMTVVTRNVEDFAPMGVRLINPWDIAASR